jgi:hypothetical protein
MSKEKIKVKHFVFACFILCLYLVTVAIIRPFVTVFVNRTGVRSLSEIRIETATFNYAAG